MSAKLVQTAFRLYEDELTKLDSLVENPPLWLRSCAPGKVKDRTDAVRRLIFIAAQQIAGFGLPTDQGQEDMRLKNVKPGRSSKKK